MQFGPFYIHSCPQCRTLIAKRTLKSGNTFGAKYYSDGKKVFPMLPEFPAIARCKNCQMIYWLNETTKIEELNFFEYDWNFSDNVDFAEFLDVYGYLEAIDKNLHQNQRDELYLRIKVWHGFNDRSRESTPIFISESDKVRWYNNCIRLLELLNSDRLNEKILTAELHRSIGNFDQTLIILNGINSLEFNELKESIAQECRIRNTLVIKLK